jgi:hypothetical protein
MAERLALLAGRLKNLMPRKAEMAAGSAALRLARIIHDVHSYTEAR